MAAQAEGTESDDTIPTPQLSLHALERWDERMPAGAVSPERALMDATPDDGIVRHPRFGSTDTPTPDRIWIYVGLEEEWFTAVFVETSGTVCTCWRGDEEQWPAISAYLTVRGLGGLADE